MKLLLPTYNKISVLFISLFLFLIINKVSAQESASYTQYMDNLTPLNSAYSLLDKAGSINTLVREQYVGIQGAPNTFIFNGNIPIESLNGAAGLIINNNNFAVEHQTEVNGYFAKAIQLAENQYLSVSLDGGVRSYVADYSGLAPDDPAFRSDVREFKTSIGFGVLYYTNEYYLGFSLPQLTLRTLGDGSVLDNNYFRNSYYFSGAIIENLGEDIKIKPATLVSYTRGVPLIADISTTFYFKDVLGLGVDYRTNNEMAGIISLALGSFHVGYSYQFGTTSNNLGGINNATYEVTLSYRFGKGAANPKLL